MSERPELLERLRQLLGIGGNGGSSTDPPSPPNHGVLPSGCEEVADLPCREAAQRVYEYLDGELDEEQTEKIRCHIRQCERCYPMFNWEKLFLDAVRERGDRPERSDELRRRVGELLDSEVY